jgi:hypothetical protein
MTYINDLGDVGRGDVALAGGKAVGLGGLIEAGLPVPPGFVLTTAAYSDFVTENHIGAAIQERAVLPAERVTAGLPGCVGADSSTVQERHHAGPDRQRTHNCLSASRRRRHSSE